MVIRSRLSFPETFHPENEISFSLTVKDKNPADRNITLQVLVTGDARTIAAETENANGRVRQVARRAANEFPVLLGAEKGWQRAQEAQRQG